MLLIEATIGVSHVAGIGLFAAQFVPKGTVIWVLHPGFDQAYTKEELDQLPAVSRKPLDTYKYLSHASGKYIICLDGARHFNHSWDPNTSCDYSIKGLSPEQRAQLTEEEWARVDPDEYVTVATRDIQIGEELTCDYEHDFPDPKDETHAFLNEIRHLKEEDTPAQ